MYGKCILFILLGSIWMEVFGKVTENRDSRWITSDQVRTETGRDRLEWFTVLDVWEEGNRDVDQIAQFLINQRGVNSFWAKVVAANYIQSRL
jgi:hypothetical protein